MTVPIPAARAVSAAASNMVLPRPGSPHKTSASLSVAAGSKERPDRFKLPAMSRKRL